MLTLDAEGGPPYCGGSFDRVLVDAPCSALGQRPSTVNNMSLNEVKSFPVLQRKLFSKVCIKLVCSLMLSKYILGNGRKDILGIEARTPGNSSKNIVRLEIVANRLR